MTESQDETTITRDPQPADTARPATGIRPEPSFLTATACAISSVYITTQSVAASVAMAVVAVILARRGGGR